MPLIPSTTLITTHALSLLLLSYYLLTSPLTLLTSPTLLILGEAMHIRPATFQPSPSRLSKGLSTLSSQSTELLAIIAVLLISYALLELFFATGLSIPNSLSKNGNKSNNDNTTITSLAAQRRNRGQTGEKLHTLTNSQSSHLNLIFLRIISCGVLCAWIYIYHSTTSKSSSSSTGSSFARPTSGLGSLGSVLGNQIVFSGSLIEMLFWGYVWTVIRDERRDVLGRVGSMRGIEDEEDE